MGLEGEDSPRGSAQGGGKEREISPVGSHIHRHVAFPQHGPEHKGGSGFILTQEKAAEDLYGDDTLRLTEKGQKFLDQSTPA